MSGLVRILLIGLALYGAWAVLLFFGQRAMLYPGARQRAVPAVPPRIPGVEPLRIPTAAGPVEAWFLPPPADTPRPAPAVVFLHGNGEVIDDWPALASGLAGRGVGVLLVEYPGYGRSAGRPSQGAITEVATAAYDSLAARADVDPHRIVAYGRSLGGGVAAQLAARRPVAALVLVSTFTSVRDFARDYLLPGWLVRDPYDTATVLVDFPGPVLVVHGRLDAMIPYRHGEELARIAPGARLVSYDSAHNDCPPDFEAHWDDVIALLTALRPAE
jgi:fermentation-respiration switch protein FrsA (DUF1100 family)